jgi:hypothetical protein
MTSNLESGVIAYKGRNAAVVLADEWVAADFPATTVEKQIGDWISITDFRPTSIWFDYVSGAGMTQCTLGMKVRIDGTDEYVLMRQNTTAWSVALGATSLTGSIGIGGANVADDLPLGGRGIEVGIFVVPLPVLQTAL